MDTLTLVLLGAVVTGFTQAAKRIFPRIPSLYIVAFVALFAGLFQSFVMPLIPPGVWQKAVQGFVSAVAFYEILIKNLKQ